jgi:gliding motility-associated lipoprotein GldH
MVSCDPQKIYEANIRIPEKGWKQSEVVRFSVNIADTANTCDIYVNVRNNSRYGSIELWLFVNVHAPSGQQERDTLKINITDEYGKWMGNGLGNTFDLRKLYRKNIRFPQKGTYIFEYMHGMRDEPLTGVEDIGLRIEKNP